MGQTDSSATRTPGIFVAIAVLLFILRLATMGDASAQAMPSTTWKLARDADKAFLPGTQDLKDQDPVVVPNAVPKPIASSSIPISRLSENDLRDLNDGKKMVVYEFVADWSDPCKTMDAKALSNKQVLRTIQDNFVAVRIRDVAREQGKNPKWISNLQKRYHIFALPTLVVAGPDGEAKASLIGNCSSLTVERFLARALSAKNP